MKITLTTARRLSPADIAAIRRMRRNLIDCHFAYITDQVCAMLLTSETTPPALKRMASECVESALTCMPDINTAVTDDGCALTLLPNGPVLIFGREGNDPGDLHAHLALRSLGLAVCEHMPILAIVTGEDAEEIDMSPDALDETLPAPDYHEELNAILARDEDDEIIFSDGDDEP